MIKRIFLTLVLLTKLFTEEVSSPHELAALNTNTLIYDCVNPITGDLTFDQTDVVVQGAEPLSFRRLYTSSEMKHSRLRWQIIPHITCVIDNSKNSIFVEEPNCVVLEYKLDKMDKDKTIASHIKDKTTKYPLIFRPYEALKAGYTSTPYQERYHPKENKIELYKNKLKVLHSNGGYKIYSPKKKIPPIEYWILEEESLPNGNKILYSTYEEYGLTKVSAINTTNPSKTKNYAIIKVTNLINSGHNPSFRLTTSNQQTLEYAFNKGVKDRLNLVTVDTVNYPKEKFKYSKKGAREKRVRPDGRELTFLYNKDLQVIKIEGPNGEMLFDIHYKPGKTVSIDSDGNKTIYFYDQKNLRLETIVHGKIKKETFNWDENGNLKEKSIFGISPRPALTYYYEYDERQNLTKYSQSGKGTTYSHYYTYNKKNRLIEEAEDNGLILKYTYHKDTNLISSKANYRYNTLLTQTNFTYNEDNILIEARETDGIETHITRTYPKTIAPFINMPEIIEELYLDGHEEKLLKKTHLTYGPHCYVYKKTVYGSDGERKFHTTESYNEKGLLVFETNAVGDDVRYLHDKNNNQTEKHDSMGLVTKYTYDKLNRLTKEIETGEGTKDSYTTSSEDFTSTGNPRIITNSLGGITQNEYDCLGRLIHTIDPSGAETNYQYDCLGNKIQIKDPRGNRTQYRYNLYGNPTLIIYPDQTKEEYTYNIDGTKKSYTDQTGFKTEYIYDDFGKIKKETNSLGTIYQTHNAYHLLEETNLEGYRTIYDYAPSGLLQSKTYVDRETTFSYDSLNRPIREITLDYILAKTYDLLDRVIDEEEHEGEKLLTKKSVEYNFLDKPTCITTYPHNKPSKTYIKYDPFGREIETKTPESITKTRYETIGNEFKVITDEPENIRTIETYNSNNQLIRSEKRKPQDNWILEKTLHTYDAKGNRYDEQVPLEKNPEGFKVIKGDPKDFKICYKCGEKGKFLSTEKILPQELVLEVTTFVYDPCGNKMREKNFIYPGSKPHTIEWTYDSLNRKITETESAAKTTKFTYTPKGELKTLTKPDDVMLLYTYDELGNPKTLHSSKGDIDYTFTYDRLGNLLKANNTIRTIDAYGNILQETLENGYILTSTYDLLGRRTSLTLPTKKTIQYTYLGPYLETISFDTLKHIYSYDLAGNLIEQKAIEGSTSTQTYDELSRPTRLTSPHYSQTQSYTPRGNISEIITNTHKSYVYDFFDHLINEPNHIYSYDSLHNRLTKDNDAYTINKLNQVKATPSTKYNYDPNGNLISKGTTTYTYDSLDRLTSVTTPLSTTTYTYDAQHRRSSKNNTSYIWDGDHELGTLETYRILGSTDNAEIGSAIAIIHNNKPHLPIHDLQGNQIILLDLEGNTVEENIFTAFGECSQYPSNWGFSSKRHDPESGFIYFGRRYYDPELGRFITSDPEGYTDSANLYAYVCNNPLVNWDPYGLTSGAPLGLLYNQDAQEIGAAFGSSTAKFLSDTGYSVTKWSDYAYRTTGYNPFDSSSSYSEMINSRASYWDAQKALSRETLDNLFGVNSDNPYTYFTDRSTRAGLELANLLLPSSIFSIPSKIKLGINTVSKVIPEAYTALKTMNLGEKILRGSALRNKEILSNSEKFTLPKKLIANRISGYTAHGLNQAIQRDGGRGVSPRVILDTVKNPRKVIEQAHGSIKYIGKNGTVVLNSEGKVITTFGKSRGPQIWDKKP